MFIETQEEVVMDYDITNKDVVRELFTYKKGRLSLSQPLHRRAKGSDPFSSLWVSGGYNYRATMLKFPGYEKPKRMYEHRLVWTYHKGEIAPGCDIVHVNGDTLDNRIANLRMASKSESPSTLRKKLYKESKRDKTKYQYHRKR